jgi:SAM-dependent methyltransferase
MYAILTNSQFRFGGGDLDEFYESGRNTIRDVIAECDRLGIAQTRGQALDFGCGVGRLTAPLAAYFDGVVGLDVAGSMIARARETHGDLCQFSVHLNDDLAMYPSRSFDFIVSLLVLQHLPSRALMERYMSEFVRILRPGGALVVNFPARVPTPPPLPPWNTKAGIRKRLGSELRHWRVSPDYLYRHLDWVPEMTMTAIPDDDVRSIFKAAGGEVSFSTEPNTDPQGTEDRIYYVTR